MSLRFVLGRAGTGKTHHCLTCMRTALKQSPQGAPLILLVPEQATFQMEQALVKTAGLRGFARAHILSFRRLAWRIFQETGGASRPRISDLGKQMILRAILLRRQSQLQLFNRAVHRSGFVERLAQTLTELRAYRKTPEDLQRQYEKLVVGSGTSSALASKIHDLALVLQDFDAALVGRFTDPDDALNLLADRLPDSNLVRGAHVWVDGFAGFTPQEFAVMDAFLDVADQVEIALCLDSTETASIDPALSTADLDETSLFHPTMETYVRLRKLAAAKGRPVLPALRLDGQTVPQRFSQAKGLARLESELYHRPPDVLEGPVPEVAVVAAADRRSEVEAAAAEILRLCRDEEYRFRDIAVIFRDSRPYSGLLRAVFEDKGIPFFMDEKRSVAHHPLVELLRSAVEVILSRWAYEPVFRFLKTDLVPMERADVDELENYVLEHGIQGPRWYDGAPWEYVRRYSLDEDQEPSPDHREQLRRINGMRRRVRGFLGPFHRAVQGRKAEMNKTVRDLCVALFELLESLDVTSTLDAWVRAAETQGRLSDAREHEQVWAGIVSLLEQMVEALGEERMLLSDFAQVLDAGLSGLRLGLIPPALDQVLVGAVDRSRHPDIRAALVLGVAEGGFPPTTAEDIVFTDAERNDLAGDGFEVGPPSRVKLFHEQFLSYIAFTRASQRLWISYPLSDEQGKSVGPSALVTKICHLLPEVTPAAAQPQTVSTWAEVGPFLGRELRAGQRRGEVDSAVLDLYEWAVTSPQVRRHVEPILRSLSYRNYLGPLPEWAIEDLYGVSLHASVSRLERYAACPFQYFAAHGLNLRPRARHGLEPADMGSFYHAALRRFVERLAREGLEWKALSRDQADQFVEEIVAELAPKLQSEILLSSARYRYVTTVLVKTLQAAVRMLTEHAARGDFRPTGVEIAFGRRDAHLPPLEIPLNRDGNMYLHGQIDRIDIAANDGAYFLRIIDYKSRRRTLSLGEVVHGLSLQLPLYLKVALHHADAWRDGREPVKPAGIFYFPVFDPVIKDDTGLSDEEVEAKRRREFRLQGLARADTTIIRLMDADVSGWSEILSVRVNKDGTLGKGSQVANGNQFETLLQYAAAKAGQIGRHILSGVIAAAPFKMANRTACQWCDYRSVCRFDALVEGNGYRNLEKLDEDAAWQNMVAETFDDAGEGGEADAEMDA